VGAIGWSALGWEATGRALDAGAVPANPDSFSLPWTDQPAELVASRGVLRAAAVGRPDGRVDRWSAMKASARRNGEARAKEALHRCVDEALAAVFSPAWVAAAAHRHIERHARKTGVRPLVDGAAVVVVEISVRPLPEVAGAPWVRP
jgi:hypothetical protein